MLLSYHNDEWRSQRKMYVSVNIWVQKPTRDNENIWVIVITGMNIRNKKNEGAEVCVKESFKTKPVKSRLR